MSWFGSRLAGVSTKVECAEADFGRESAAE
jgi:hypothetical protein